MPWKTLLTLFAAYALTGFASAEVPFVNSLGMRLVPIQPGTFAMGESNRVPVAAFAAPLYLHRGDWDEHPVHLVTLTKGYLMADEEVTVEQFRRFRPDFQGNPANGQYVSGVSWTEAVAFCEWLSRQDGRSYRLPTEAEWEYAARAGTTSLFSSGDTPPPPDTANAWGLRNMHTGVSEWCLDWHGEYPLDPQTDPVGPVSGWARVVRGGGLDAHTPFYARSANRGGMPPNFPPVSVEHLQALARGSDAQTLPTSTATAAPQHGEFRAEDLNQKFTRQILNHQGQHPIGFRVVCAGPVPRATDPVRVSYAQLGVHQGGASSAIGPDPARPWFRKRYLLPTPPENTAPERMKTFRALGWPRAFLRHMHSPALAVANNGDVIFISFTAVGELDADVALLTTRLRFGTDEWDSPDLFLDLPDVDDHAPMLWNDAGRLWFFWGSNRLDAGFPFQWITSDDCGATWSQVNFPLFTTSIGGHSAQPITSAFRDADGRIYVASDAIGASSVLWQSADNGQTWRDPGGRSAGRHTAFVMLRDGTILGMGGKNSDIRGFMPKAISRDRGATYTVSASPVPHLGFNQRPTMIRLASGRLFLAGDFQSIKGEQPQGITARGSYAALSDDEGQTWTMRALPGTQPHKRAEQAAKMGGDTLGYAVARQAPNGIIHLVATMTEPCLHFELNEAWILAGSSRPGSESALRANSATAIRDVREFAEYDAEGRITARYHGGIGNDGRFLLHGASTWLYADGSVQRRAEYALGRLVGREEFHDAKGNLCWSCDHRPDGTDVRQQFWPSGKVRSQSTWRDLHAEETAVLYDPEGREVYRVEFVHGVAEKETGDPGEY